MNVRTCTRPQSRDGSTDALAPNHHAGTVEPLVIRSSNPRTDDIPLALAAETQLGHVLRVECAVPYACAQVQEAPLVLEVQFHYDSTSASDSRTTSKQSERPTHVQLVLPLPISLTRFLEPIAGALSSNDFFGRWHQIGSANPREAQHIFRLAQPSPTPHPNDPVTPTDPAQTARDHDQAVGNALLRARRVLARSGFAQLPGIDKNPANLVGAGVLLTAARGNVGCLLRLELNRQSGVCSSSEPFLIETDVY